jgi:cytochrome P450
VAAIARPPGPKGRWLDGSLRAFRRDPLRFLEKLSEDCGPLGYFRAGHQHIYFANDPSLVEEVLVTQNSAFIKSRILQRAKALLGEGLLTNEGASHLRQRRLVQPAFHRQRLMGYAETMAELALRARERWKDGEEMDIDREMMRLTLAIVGRTLFSADVEDEAPMVGEAMNALLETMPLLMLPGSQYFHLLPLPAMRRFKQAGEMLDRTIYRIIEERRRSGEDTGDLLSMLLLATDAEGDGQGMTDRQVRDETLTLFLAGHETTATALTWTWYLLAQNPEVERKMQAEVDAALGGRAPGFADLPALPYCEHVLAESMRLYPPAWGIGRMATREVELGGYNVPPGSIVPLHHAAQGGVLAGARSILAGALGCPGKREAEVRLLSVRRGAAHMRRRAIRVDGGHPHTRRRGADLAVPAAGECAAGGVASIDNAAPARRDPFAGETAVTGYWRPWLFKRAGRNSSPSFQPGIAVMLATCRPTAKPKRAICSGPPMSQLSEYSSEGW